MLISLCIITSKDPCTDCLNIFCSGRELEVTWAAMEFEYSAHERTGVKLPKASEEVVETLENDQVIEFCISLV